jgi:hypothetical protein
MDGDFPHVEIYEWFRELERIKGVGNIELINAIEERIGTEFDQIKLRVLKLCLAGEYKEHSRYAEAEEIYLDLFKRSPDEPFPLISLAEQKLYREDQPERAMDVVDRALDAAYRSNNFRRLALGVKARIAIKLKAYNIVEDVLTQLMQLEFAPGNADCGIERDFLDRTPSRAINEDVARKYDQFAQRGA